MRSTSTGLSMPFSPRAGLLFPSGRQARSARGPRAPVPVAILAAGQGFGGSDVPARAEEAGHVAVCKGGSDVGLGAGRSLNQPFSSRGKLPEITSGA